VKAAPLGQPTGPVQTSTGFDVILVTNYQAPTFEQVATQLLQGLQQQADQTAGQNTNAAMSAVVAKALKGVKVTVDPRYGTWVDDSSGPHVAAPSVPAPRSTRLKPPPTTASPLGTAPVSP